MHWQVKCGVGDGSPPFAFGKQEAPKTGMAEQISGAIPSLHQIWYTRYNSTNIPDQKVELKQLTRYADDSGIFQGNMNKLVLLLSSSTVFVPMLSMLLMVNPAHAEPVAEATQTSCNNPYNPSKFRVSCVRVAQASNNLPRTIEFKAPQAAIAPASTQDGETPMLEFTEEESDSAVALYGCDCPACLNALRQLRSQPPVAS